MSSDRRTGVKRFLDVMVLYLIGLPVIAMAVIVFIMGVLGMAPHKPVSSPPRQGVKQLPFTDLTKRAAQLTCCPDAACDYESWGGSSCANCGADCTDCPYVLEDAR